MTFKVVESKLKTRKPEIHIYTRGTIQLNVAAYNYMRGWTRVLLLFDKDTRRLRMVRDVSLDNEEQLIHVRKITKSGCTGCVTARRLIVEFDVVEQHNVKMTEMGKDFLEFGPIEMEGDKDAASSS